MYQVVLSRRYKTALKRIFRHKDFNGETLEKIVETLSRGEKLDAKYHDHQLTGKFNGRRECHLQHNLLLMYQIHADVLVLILVDLGTHDDFFR